MFDLSQSLMYMGHTAVHNDSMHSMYKYFVIAISYMEALHSFSLPPP